MLESLHEAIEVKRLQARYMMMIDECADSQEAILDHGY